jgi:hypothetical protein
MASTRLNALQGKAMQLAIEKYIDNPNNPVAFPHVLLSSLIWQTDSTVFHVRNLKMSSPPPSQNSYN